MKRGMALCLLLALLFALTGCMSAEERQERKEALDALNGDCDGKYALSTGTTVDNQCLFDSGGVIVQLAGIQGTPWRPELVLAVKNGTRSDIVIYTDSMSVNGWQVEAWSDLYQVSARSVALGTMECGTDLAFCAIEDVGRVSLELSIYRESDYEEIGACTAEVNTSAGDWVEDSFVPDGIALIEEPEYQVWAVSLGDTVTGTLLRLYLENDSGREIELDTAKARLNGQPLEMWAWDSVAPGTRRMLDIYLYTEDTYEDVYLKNTDQLTFDLILYDYETGMELAGQSVSLTPGEFA